MDKAERLAELVLIYFTKEELHPDEATETKAEMIELAREIEIDTDTRLLADISFTPSAEFIAKVAEGEDPK